MKSERLKKLEADLRDLEQWLKLGLVPKKDVQKHQEEMRLLQQKVEEEKERLQFLKESGEAEEYVAPKRPGAARAGYPEGPTISDIDMMEEPSGLTESSIDMDTESVETDTFSGEERTESSDETVVEETEEEDEDPFSDKNRWKRGIVDPESDQW
ncbi:MAG: hypothetical protein P4L16_04505 [Chlamydiales bacterium]|nr:hypothetical protein [Chlamydiales bacterium]